MDTQVYYKATLRHETKLRDFIYSLYEIFWPFIGSLRCSEKMALGSYKRDSSILNAILWMPDGKDQLKQQVIIHLRENNAAIPFFESMTIQFLKKELATIAILERLFVKAPLTPQKFTVFRGVSTKKFVEIWENLKIGDRWTSKSFISTSFNISTSLMFAQFAEPLGCLIQIQLPKKTPYLLLPGSAISDPAEELSFEEMISSKIPLRDEMELLLNKNTTFELMGIDKLAMMPSKNLKAKTYLEDTYMLVFKTKVVSTEHQIFSETPETLIEQMADVTLHLKWPTYQPNGKQ
jgi:hypothetical protein